MSFWKKTRPERSSSRPTVFGNHLAHRYNRMDDLLARDSMKALLPGLEDFSEEVEAWIEKRL